MSVLDKGWDIAYTVPVLRSPVFTRPVDIRPGEAGCLRLRAKDDAGGHPVQGDKDSQMINDRDHDQAMTAIGPAKRPWRRPTITVIEVKRSMFNFGVGLDGSTSHS